jgi:hypothetical protein
MSGLHVSRRDPYEACARCETFHLASEMTSVPARDAHGNPVTLRVCRACLHPRITYIQSGATFLQLGADMATVLGAALAVIVIAVGILFGMIIGSTAGFVIVVTCSLIGAGILAAEAARHCGL